MKNEIIIIFISLKGPNALRRCNLFFAFVVLLIVFLWSETRRKTAPADVLAVTALALAGAAVFSEFVVWFFFA
jgi:hypothetical protein